MKKILCILLFFTITNLSAKQKKDFALVTMMKTGTHLTNKLLTQLNHNTMKQKLQIDFYQFSCYT